MTNKMMPLVSVVCPTYNENNFFKAAYESILNQTYSNIEFIIVDSSTNHYVKDIIDLSDSRIHYFWQEKRGIANALNYGIEHAQGEFIARMDADDISSEKRIEKQVNYMLAHPDIMLVGTQAIMINADGKVIGVSSMPLHNDDIKASLLFTNCFIHPSIMLRKQVFCRVSYDNTCISEDYDLWTKMPLNYFMENMPDSLLLYRKHEINASLRLRHKASESASRSSRRYIEDIFGLDLTGYDIDDTCQLKSEFEHHHNPAEYIGRQIKLMSEIWNANSEKNFLNRTSLSMVLNKRWQWDFDLLGGVENICKYSRINFSTWALDSDDKELFLYVLSRKYNCELKNISTTIRNDLEVLTHDYQNFLREKKNIAVYGLGRRGRHFLEQLYEKRKSGECGWNLVAVSDKKIEGIEFENIFYHTTSLLKLSCVEADYIVITPRDYRQIEIELLDYGIEMDRILTANMLI